MSSRTDALNSSTQERWVTGDNFGLPIPADPEALLAGGVEFLTKAFRASGVLSATNSVVAIVESSEFFDGGSGKKLKMTVVYEQPDTALPDRLFVKFSRHFDNDLWDSAKWMMLSEVNFALLSRSPDFPVMVPVFMFADLEAESATGLLITELIPYGEGNVEPAHAKCMDYLIPDAVEHYRAIFRSLGRLSGSHRAGKLSSEFDELFPDAEQGSAMFRIPVSDEQSIVRANKMFDFIQRYPKLFPEDLLDPSLREQFIAYMGDAFAVRERIQEILLSGRPRFVAFAHWNGNIDNCWFERDDQGELECGFIDWANCGQLPLTQVVGGALGCAESYVFAEHLDELLGIMIDEFEAQGGPHLDLGEISLHVRLSMASNFGLSMAAPVAIARDNDDIDSLSGPRDPFFRDHYASRVMLHTMTGMLENWKNLGLGDLVRQLR
ncbi:MAG: hypothetical protein Q7L55_11785 [Actinomycetota bacterium]|nr:hypothetical protein [Actinomycetota bacterium]